MPHLVLDKSTFQLDSSGIAGFFGGDEAVNAMATVHIYKGRKWLGWYNSPGSYNIAKRYGQLARARFWRGLFSGDKTDAATLFGLDGKKGPKFKGFHSGTTIEETGHIGSLFMDECEDSNPIKLRGRQTNPVSVTVVDFGPPPETIVPLVLQRSKVTILSFIPILFSLGCCIACGVFLDWYCFSMILLGIVTSGLSCLTIGSGDLFFTHPQPADGSPRGDGFMRNNKGVVILCGEEGAVNSVTRGKFILQFAGPQSKSDSESNNRPKSKTDIESSNQSKAKIEYNLDRKVEPEHIGTCSTLLIIQFLTQLLLIPQGTLFGQIMFLSSLAISWTYNSYLSSMDRNRIQRQLLMEGIFKKKTTMRRYVLGNWTGMTVFALLAARPPNPRSLLNELITNDTEVWKIWKEWVLSNLEKDLWFDHPPSLERLDEKEKKLLLSIVQDSRNAFTGFSQGEKAGQSRPQSESS